MKVTVPAFFEIWIKKEINSNKYLSFKDKNIRDVKWVNFFFLLIIKKVISYVPIRNLGNKALI